MTLQNNNKV